MVNLRFRYLKATRNFACLKSVLDSWKKRANELGLKRSSMLN